MANLTTYTNFSIYQNRSNIPYQGAQIFKNLKTLLNLAEFLVLIFTTPFGEKMARVEPIEKTVNIW